MSFLRLSLTDTSISLTRCISSRASRATNVADTLYRFKLPIPNKTSEGKDGSSASTSTSTSANASKDKYANRQTPAEFLKHRERMKSRFPEGWNPPRKLSREAMEGVRALHQHDPKTFSTPVLAERFRISPEAVRRILKSKWTPSKEEKAKLLAKDRRRKEENIVKRIERERADKWQQIDRHEKTEEEERPRWEKKDRLSLV